LDFQGVEGKGIMFHRADSPGEELEIGCVIMTKSKVGVEEEFSPVIPQFAVATVVDETSCADADYLHEVEAESEPIQEHFVVDCVSSDVTSDQLSAESDQLSGPFMAEVVLEDDEIVLQEEDVIVIPIEEATVVSAEIIHPPK
jgi:hypothetical protein